MTVNSLPDSIFLEIFALCLSSTFSDNRYTITTSTSASRHAEEWQRLVQVCKRWQQIIYGSPRYLDLHLHCSIATPFKENLTRWPEFPLTIDHIIHPDDEDSNVDDLIASLEQPGRVHFIDLMIVTPYSRADEVLEKMKVPFTALTHLNLVGPDQEDDPKGTVLPPGFLGGSAPCLQHLRFNAVNATLFQELRMLLLSARGLVSLQLEDIPDGFGYISPEAIVGGLAGLTKLKTLSITFRSPEDAPDSNEGLEHRKRPEPSMRTVLPALTEFVFRGESVYLEDIVARIDMPCVEDIKIDYFPPGAEAHELSQFISRTERLCLAQFRHAEVCLRVGDANIHIKLDRARGEHLQFRFSLGMTISDPDGRYPDLDYMVTCMGRVFNQLTALLSYVDHVSFTGLKGWNERSNRLDNSKLLPVLHLFPAVEALHVSGVFLEPIAAVLENIDEGRVSEVMPVLRSLQLDDGDGPVGSTNRFLSLRQLSGHPVAVVNTNTQDEVE